MRALCVGRHRFLSDHIGAFFGGIGLDCVSVVGVSEAAAAAAEHRPDVVICEYDLLATHPLREWESDPVLSRVPVIAVSLTRRADESNVLDVNGIAGFHYLPALTAEDARAVLRAVRPRIQYTLPSVLDRERDLSRPR